MQGVRTAEKLAEETKLTESDRELYLYWENCLKRAEKTQPIKEWNAAKNRLECKPKSDTDDNKPYVNGFRLHYETLKSFLDQSVAEFKITPTEAFLMNKIVLKQAECELAYLSYVWNEQECQIASSQKLDSAIIRNIGVTLPGFDRKKWMPNLKYISAKNVLLDPDCNGIRSGAKWEGYKESITVEELVSKNPNLTDEEIEKIKKDGGSILSEEDKVDMEDDLDSKLFTVITLYHVFARNDAAIRKVKDDEEVIDKEEVQKLNLAVPKRYLQFVKGLEKPLKDTDGWPYELDDNEFPTTILRFNTPVENSYGFTDNIQMEKLDAAFDNVMHDIEESAYWEGNKKFGGTPEAGDLTDTDIEKMLKDPKKYYFKNMIGSDGKPKIVQIDTGKFSPELVQALKLIDEQRDKASALGELMAVEASHFKDVTAIGVRVHDANVHQKVNRRLGGPEGYEKSITEDAIKMLEIAHQLVPRYSLLEIPEPQLAEDEFGEFYETGQFEIKQHSIRFEQVPDALNRPGAKLLVLGADAIVGPELVWYWQWETDETLTNIPKEEVPPFIQRYIVKDNDLTVDLLIPGASSKIIKLSTKVRVLPGSTRTITKEHRAAILKQYYLELYQPFYEAMNRWDLAKNFLDYIGALVGLGKDLLPDMASVQQFMQKQEMEKQMAMKMQMQEQVMKVQGQAKEKGE